MHPCAVFPKKMTIGDREPGIKDDAENKSLLERWVRC